MSTLKPNAPTPGPWTVGRERILELISAGELERVVVNREYAQGLLLRARRHLKTAHRLVVDDPEGSYTLLYDASRLAMTAALAVQGLRPTTREVISWWVMPCVLSEALMMRWVSCILACVELAMRLSILVWIMSL